MKATEELVELAQLSEKVSNTLLHLKVHLPAISLSHSLMIYKEATKLLDTLCETTGNEPCVRTTTGVYLCSSCTIAILDLIRIAVWRHSNSLKLSIQSIDSHETNACLQAPGPQEES